MYRKEVPLLSAVAAQLRHADSLLLANMHQRIGSTPLPNERMSWGRVIEARADIRQNGEAKAKSSGNYSGLQFGSDIWKNNYWRIGGYAGYLYGDLKVNGFASGKNDRVGKNALRSYSLGIYGTYTDDKATYIDVVLQGSRHHVDIKPDNNANFTAKGHGFTASVEVGKPFIIGHGGWKLEPQAQIIHQWFDLKDKDIKGQTTVKQSHNDKWLFRIGTRLEGSYQTNKGILHPYARLNVFYSPNGADRTSFTTSATTTTVQAGTAHTSTELAIGGSYKMTDKVSAYGEIGHSWSNGGKAKVKVPVSGSIGLKIIW